MLLSQRLKTAVLELFFGTYELPYEVADWTVTDTATASTFQKFADEGLQIIWQTNFQTWTAERTILEAEFTQIAKRNMTLTGRHDKTTGSPDPEANLRVYSVPNADGTGARTLLDAELDMPDNYLFTMSWKTPDDHAALVIEWDFADNGVSATGNKFSLLRDLVLAYVE